ncbi:MAG: hypothetical protein H0X31_09795 [Nostocaceae cyanobacterium]|nr:hypothetical protein [Nostocaceae cyanobacterium]
MSSNSVECNYLGWGELTNFQSKVVGKNEALIFTPPADSAPVLIQGFLDCLRSTETRAKIPSQFSENDLAGVMVEMVRTLPKDLWNEWTKDNAQKVVCAVLRWSAI